MLPPFDALRPALDVLPAEADLLPVPGQALDHVVPICVFNPAFPAHDFGFAWRMLVF